MGATNLSRWSLVPFLFLTGTVWAWETPVARAEAEKETVRYSGTLRAQLRYKNWLPLVETNYRLEGGNSGDPRVAGVNPTNQTSAGLDRFSQQTWHAMLGTYYNILPQIMLGGFYRYGMGERHRNDWVGSGWNQAVGTSNTWDWFWLNTNNRSEQSVVGDITLRQKLPFMPGENWVFELKNRIHYTWYTDDRYASRDNWGQGSANVAETKYVLRPGLQYFWMDGDKPFMTFFLQYEAHFALNFGSRTLVESWGYFGFFYHITEEVAFGLNVARAQWWWSTSDSVSNIRSAEDCSVAAGSSQTAKCNSLSYLSTQRAWVVGFTAMLRLDFTPIE